LTIIVAAKAGPGLCPRGRSFVFEPGIVIAADTRLTYEDGTYVDDGLKAGVIGPHGVVAMSSDNISVPVEAFARLDDYLDRNILSNSVTAVGTLQALLREINAAKEFQLGKRINTLSLFAYRDPTTGAMNLFYLSKAQNFAPQLRSGFVAAGAVAYVTEVNDCFRHIRDEYPALTLRPFDGFPGDVVSLREGVAALAMTIVHAALELAETREAATGVPEPIGGEVQAAIVSSRGAQVANPAWNEHLRTWQIPGGGLA